MKTSPGYQASLGYIWAMCDVEAKHSLGRGRIVDTCRAHAEIGQRIWALGRQTDAAGRRTERFPTSRVHFCVFSGPAYSPPSSIYPSPHPSSTYHAPTPYDSRTATAPSQPQTQLFSEMTGRSQFMSGHVGST